MSSQSDRVLRADDRQRAHQKGRVRGDHHTPGTRIVARGVEQQEDDCGHDQSGERGDDGYRGAGTVGELTDGELALDLKADDEEKERHQAVVDQMLDRQLGMEVAETQPDGRAPEVGIALRPR